MNKNLTENNKGSLEINKDSRPKPTPKALDHTHYNKNLI